MLSVIASCLLDLTCLFFFFSSRRRHTRSKRDWSSDVCSSDLCQRLAGARCSPGLASGPHTLAVHLGVRATHPWRPSPGSSPQSCSKALTGGQERSEERRVGKEGRSWRGGEASNGQ